MYVLETLFHLRLWLSPLDYRYSGQALLFNVLLSPLDYRYSGQAYYSMFCLFIVSFL